VRRREFITLLGGAAAAWPMAARAQQPAMPVIGFLSSASPTAYAQLVAGFHAGLNETGYVEGQNVAIEYRWAEGQYDRLPALAADLVRRQVAVIIASGGPTPALAARRATATIPIVFTSVDDPIKMGLVASLNRPSGNATGMSLFTDVLAAKQLELIRELVPKASAIGILVNPDNPITEVNLRHTQDEAHKLGLTVHVLKASTESHLDAAFATVAQQRIAMVLVGVDTLFNTKREHIIALAASHLVPAVYQFRMFPISGGLISYGANVTDAYRQVGVYTGRILKGAKPADLPVVQPTRFELVINLKTAKEALINAGRCDRLRLRRTFFLSKPPAHSGGRERMAWCRQADGSVLRARYRFASANSENTWAPFLAMPR
jgi:putative ABC transport system substrate-binding protein